MSDTENKEVGTPGVPDNAQAVPEIPVTLETAKALGYDSVEALQEKLKAAQNLNKSSETIASLVTALTDSVQALTTATNAYREEKVKQIQEDEFDALAKEKIVATFKALPENDERRQEIAKELKQAGYGANDISLVLTGTELQKTLLRPVSKTNKYSDEYREFRKAWDLTWILAAFYKGVGEGANSDDVAIKPELLMKAADRLDMAGLYGMDKVKESIEDARQKAMSDTTGYGGDWIPTILSGDMVADVWLALQVAALFRRYQMPSKTFEVPIRTSRARAFLVDETTGDTSVGDATPFFANQIRPSSMGTSKVTFLARKLGAVIFVSDELEQDSIIAILEMLREEILYGMADAIEDATINGTYGTSLGAVQGKMDNAAAGAGDRLWSDSGAGIRDSRAAWNGLRFETFLSNVTTIDGAPSSSWAAEGLDFYRNARKEMGKYGAVTTDDLVWLISPEQHIELLKLNQVITMDKIGDRATVLSGQIGMLDGVPLVISPRIYSNLNNKGFFSNGSAETPGAGNGSLTGVASSATDNKTTSVLVNRRGFAFGDRQMIRAESERQPLAGQRYVMATARMDFKKLFETAEPLSNLIYNLAK
jgi:HK97 family phage major capsid protein